MPNDLASAKAEFNTALPNWWYVIEENDDEYSVTLGPHDDADETYTYRLSTGSAAETLRQATRKAVEDIGG